MRSAPNETSAESNPRPRTRAEQLAADLSREILEGSLPPGARLDEHSLARRFGVSRTPVREALKRLAGLDLIDVRPHRGAVVVDMSETRIAELFEALAEAEAVCARLAALKMSTLEREHIGRLHRAFCDLGPMGEPTSVAAANRVFHEAIYAGAHNGFLSDHVVALRKRLAPFTAAQFRLNGRPPDSAREHQAIVTAILARDGAAAAEAVRRHVLIVGHEWARWAQERSATGDAARETDSLLDPSMASR